MKFLNFTAGAGLLLGTLLLAQPSWAQDHAQHSHAHGPASAAEAQELTSGEVRRIDMGTRKITIRHGEIQHLDMPPMTMVFTAADPALLAGLRVGDAIRFAAQQEQGRLMVTRIERAP